MNTTGLNKFKHVSYDTGRSRLRPVGSGSGLGTCTGSVLTLVTEGVFHIKGGQLTEHIISIHSSRR